MAEYKNPLKIDVTVRGVGATGAPGVPGVPGPKGDPGEKGDPLRFEDLTPEQVEELRPDPYDDTAVKKSIADLEGKVDELEKKPAGFSGDYDDLRNKPELFSGRYDDLQNKPTIPAPYDDGKIKEELLQYDERISALEEGGSTGGTVNVSEGLKTILQRIQTEIKACVRDDSVVPNSYIDTTDSLINALGTGTDTPSEPVEGGISASWSGAIATINNLKNLTVSYNGNVATVGV